MNVKRILAITLALLMLLLTACGNYSEAPDITRAPETQSATSSEDITEPVTEPVTDAVTESATEPTDTTTEEPVTKPITEAASADPTSEATSDTEAPQDNAPDVYLPEYGEYYYDVVNVVLYLEAYGELPPNYITKNEARELGWTGGSVERYLEGAAIGGDYFGNYEGLLPTADGRRYTECDIDTDGYSSRGSRRLIFSNDGLYFYTSDHYESFSEVIVNDDYEVVW